MRVKTKPSRKLKKPVPQGRKMSKEEARNYVFKTYSATMASLAKH